MMHVLRWSYLWFLFLAGSLSAQNVDSFLQVADGATNTIEQRVRIWRDLLRDRSVSGKEIADRPFVGLVLKDTLSDNGWSWLLLGNMHHQDAAFGPATVALERARESFRAKADEASYALATSDKANALSVKGDQTTAMRLFYEALSILHRTGPETEEAEAMLGLAFIFRYQEDHAKALELYRQVGAIGQRTHHGLLLVDALRGEAGVQLELGRTDTALVMYEEALDRSERLGSQRRMSVLHVELANILVKEQDYEGARKEFLEALEVFEERSNSIWTSYTLARLAEVAHAQGDDNAALRYGERGLALAKEKGLLKESLDNLFVLPEICAALGRYDQALEHSLAFESLFDTMRNDATRTELARLEIQQEQVRDSLLRAEERERERVDFEANVAKARNQRNIFLFIGLGVLVLVGGLWSRLRHTRRLARELAEGNALIEQEVQRAERSEKVKEQFLANMSHEIRTPMNAIMGMTAILRRNRRMPGQDRYLDAIAQSSSNLLVILNDILDLGKLEAGKVELENVPMEPRKVLGNVLDILRFKAEEKGLKLDLHCTDEVPQQLIGDPTRLNQIMLNLVGNAIKFTEKGSVTVDVSRAPSEEGPGVVDPAQPIRVRYKVRDTGIGIRKERIKEIFEEFTQAYSDTTRKYGGTGLGLTITKRLIELQGGTVGVDSTPDQGSTFTVEIPYAPGPEGEAMAGAEDAPAGVVLDGIRILMAEDNEFNVMVAQDELQDAIPGVRVDVAANGRIAVEMAGSHAYDVVLMDIQMPEMNGIDATMAIRGMSGAAGRVPIIAMTANVLKSEVDRCMEAGMNAFVPKPFERKDLLDKLAMVIAKRSDRT